MPAAQNRRQPQKRPGAGRFARFTAWLKRELAKRPLPLWCVIVADILVFAVAIIVFALFHHVLPRARVSANIVSARPGTAVQAAPVELQPAATDMPVATEAALIEEVPEIPEETQAPQATAVPAPTATAEPIPVGYFGHKWPEKFESTSVHQSDDAYRSPNINMTVKKIEGDKQIYYVADFYIKDISSFQTALAEDKYGSFREWPREMARRHGGIVAVNGDYYGTRSEGFVARNGTVYREERVLERDICVLYWDGVMETYAPYEFNASEAIARGMYQAWNFGPALLDANGDPLSEFNTDVAKSNPRTAVGYYEPGHYCFFVADGRSKKAKGPTMQELAQVMHDLGCKAAYNMDGGDTSQMVFNDKVISNPSDGGRKCSDILMVVEPE
ncbi:MAG: phosphodiester glycosidase family protein [Clostridiales bacterium]|nr:phosphodiester glycosidase family protein [Clostridiales bacterium]